MSLLFFILGPSFFIGLFIAAIWLVFKVLKTIFRGPRADLVAENERLRTLRCDGCGLQKMHVPKLLKALDNVLHIY